MKLAFSTAGYPTWNLEAVLAKAKEHGFEGVELCGLPRQLHLPLATELAADAQKAAQLSRQTGVEIICLATHATFQMRDAASVARNQAHVRELIDLAAKIGCPFVRVFPGGIPELPCRILGPERRATVMARISRALRELVADATGRGVTLVVENGGGFLDSASLWHLVEPVDSPMVRCCWNVLSARIGGERPTIAVPRLSARLALVHVCDAKVDATGRLQDYSPPGQGDIEIPRMVQLLKGVGYSGYLVFDWPELWNPAACDADSVLPEAAKYLRALIDEKPIVLTAYKGDKFRPRQGYELPAD